MSEMEEIKKINELIELALNDETNEKEVVIRVPAHLVKYMDFSTIPPPSNYIPPTSIKEQVT